MYIIITSCYQLYFQFVYHIDLLHKYFSFMLHYLDIHYKHVFCHFFGFVWVDANNEKLLFH